MMTHKIADAQKNLHSPQLDMDPLSFSPQARESYNQKKIVNFNKRVKS